MSQKTSKYARTHIALEGAFLIAVLLMGALIILSFILGSGTFGGAGKLAFNLTFAAAGLGGAVCIAGFIVSSKAEREEGLTKLPGLADWIASRGSSH